MQHNPGKRGRSGRHHFLLSQLAGAHFLFICSHGLRIFRGKTRDFLAMVRKSNEKRTNSRGQVWLWH